MKQPKASPSNLPSPDIKIFKKFLILWDLSPTGLHLLTQTSTFSPPHCHFCSTVTTISIIITTTTTTAKGGVMSITPHTTSRLPPPPPPTMLLLLTLTHTACFCLVQQTEYCRLACRCGCHSCCRSRQSACHYSPTPPRNPTLHPSRPCPRPPTADPDVTDIAYVTNTCLYPCPQVQVPSHH